MIAMFVKCVNYLCFALNENLNGGAELLEVSIDMIPRGEDNLNF